MKQSIILLEFNEITPQLIARFIKEGYLPNFEKFYNQSDIFTTISDEPEAPFLEPWIQWYSLHTGLPYSEHKVFRLRDGLSQKHDDIWTILSRSGLRVANMSSMNTRPLSTGSNGDVYIPDPWCSNVKAKPEHLQKFQDFVASNVQEYTKKPSNDYKQVFQFLSFMIANGLSISTAIKTIKQLYNEKYAEGNSYWKRATILDMFQWDLFSHIIRKTKPNFSTFFINSTAHYQHSYWKDMDPKHFDKNNVADSLYKNAILYGYQCMDNLLGEAFKIEKKFGALLVLCSALSQQPYFDPNHPEGRLYYRPIDIKEFLSKIGIKSCQISPVMTHQYRLYFNTDELAYKAAKLLERFEIKGKRLFQIQHDNECQLYIGNWLHGEIARDELITRTDTKESLPFYDVFYRIDVTKSGRHHPDGVLWIKRGDHHEHTLRPSILDVFPSILAHFNVRDVSDDGYVRNGKILDPFIN